MFHKHKTLISQICLFSKFVYIPVSEHFILCQDNPSTLQVWPIKKLIKQHGHYVVLGTIKGHSKMCSFITEHNATDVSIGMLIAQMSTRAVAR